MDFVYARQKAIADFRLPLDHTLLRIADDQMIARINRAITAGRIANRAGRRLERPIDGGLLDANKTALYPILDSIPVLLADEAIPLTQI
jgi:uncharacterized protein YbaR (Trm112 family)